MSSVSVRKQELEQKISDLEASLGDLKQRLQQEIESEQHDAIDHLDDYLEEVDHKYSNLREFLTMMIAEIRGLFGGNDLSKEKER